MSKEKKVEVVFSPGCFDNFEGTQEELDQLVAHIKDIFENENFSDAEFQPIDLNEILEEFDEDELEEFQQEVNQLSDRKRILN